MELKDLTDEQLIDLAYMRAKHKETSFSGTITDIVIKDKKSKYFNGASFLIKSEEYDDYLLGVSFDMFYINEISYLIKIGVKF